MFLAAFVAEIALITYRGFRTPGPLGRMPLPANYTGAILVYGSLGLLGRPKAEPVAAAVAWGFVVATLLNLWTPKSPAHVGKPASKKVVTA